MSALNEALLNWNPRGINKWDLLTNDLEETSVVFENGNLKRIETAQESGVGIRVFYDGRIGFSCTTDPSKLNDMVEKAKGVSAFGPTVDFDLPAKAAVSEVKTYDASIEKITGEKMVSLGKKIVEKLKAAIPEGQINVDLSKSVIGTQVVNSSGNNLHYNSSEFDVSLVVLLVKGDSLLWLDEYHSSINDKLPIDQLVDNVIQKEKWAQKEVEVPTGKMPVLFTARAMPTLWKGFKLGLNGKIKYKGISPIGDKIGEKILDERLFLSDNPLMDNQVASEPFDGEGLPGKELCLIENGTLKNFVYDLQTAHLSGTCSTAAADRSYDSLPAPGYSNFCINPGDTSLKNMVDSIDRGLLLDAVLGGGQSNLLMGEFAVNVELGYLIEKGEIIGRVKNAMVGGNIYDIFKNKIKSFSEETENRHNCFTPHFLFDALAVAGR